MILHTKTYLFALLAVGCLVGGSARAQSVDTGSGMIRGPVASPTGPVGQRAAMPFATSSTARPPTSEAPPPYGSAGLYLLAPQDVVEVKVFQEDDLLTDARITQEGTIKFPLIGSVRIAGRTEEAAAQAIAAELAKDYIINPQVTVKVTEYAQRRYTVLGQVGKPGTYAMPDRDSITLFEAVGNAGGFTRIANLGDIKLKRIVEGKDMLYKLSAKGGNASDRQSSTFEIKPGDIITVGESFF